jgi:hypothetical protein
MATPELAPELAPIVPKAEAAAGRSGHDSDHAADAPCTPCQKPSKEPAPTPVPKKTYANSDMLAIYNRMDLPQLTAQPCWSIDPNDADGVWSGASCFAVKEDVLANLGTVRSLLVKVSAAVCGWCWKHSCRTAWTAQVQHSWFWKHSCRTAWTAWPAQVQHSCCRKHSCRMQVIACSRWCASAG